MHDMHDQLAQCNAISAVDSLELLKSNVKTININVNDQAV